MLGGICSNCSAPLTINNWTRDTHGKCKSCYNAKKYAERAARKDHYLAYKRSHRRLVKSKAVALLGGYCECCGEQCLDFLNVDHRDGTGHLDRKKNLYASSLYSAIVGQRYENIVNLRILCYNCNCAFGSYGVCPHKAQDTTNYENCIECGSCLSLTHLRATKQYRTYHKFFKASSLQLCIYCVYKAKTGLLLSDVERKNRLQALTRRCTVIDNYGGACVCCGESRYIFLTIDHINYHDGLSDWQLYRHLIKNNFPTDNYQLLCYNCNCARGHYGSDGICPHKKPENCPG